jgi:hypothetical protein
MKWLKWSERCVIIAPEICVEGKLPHCIALGGLWAGPSKLDLHPSIPSYSIPATANTKKPKGMQSTPRKTKERTRRESKRIERMRAPKIMHQQHARNQKEVICKLRQT